MSLGAFGQSVIKLDNEIHFQESYFFQELSGVDTFQVLPDMKVYVISALVIDDTLKIQGEVKSLGEYANEPIHLPAGNYSNIGALFGPNGDTLSFITGINGTTIIQVVKKKE